MNQSFLSFNFFMNKIISYTMINKNCQEEIIKRNFHRLGCLNGLFIGHETYLLHNRAHSINFNRIFNENLMLMTNRFIYQLETKDILLKLFIAILIFSTDLSVVSYTNFEENQYKNIFIDLFMEIYVI